MRRITTHRCKTFLPNMPDMPDIFRHSCLSLIQMLKNRPGMPMSDMPSNVKLFPPVFRRYLLLSDMPVIGLTCLVCHYQTIPRLFVHSKIPPRRDAMISYKPVQSSAYVCASRQTELHNHNNHQDLPVKKKRKSFFFATALIR